MSDVEFVSVQFQFEGETYLSLIRKKKKIDCTEYYITVMNGELEKLLYGNHIITEIDGKLHADCQSDDKRLLQLKQAITDALQQYLRSENSREVATSI
jgi:hypothetical protein